MKRRITAFIMAFCMIITVLSPAAGTIAAEDLSAVSGVTQTLPEETVAEPSKEHTPAPASEVQTEQMTETKTSEVIAGLNTQTETVTEAVTEKVEEPKTEAPTEATEEATESTEAKTEASTEAKTESTEAPTEAPTEQETEAPETNAPVKTPESTEAQTEAKTEAPTEKETEAKTEVSTEASEKEDEKKELSVSLKASSNHAFANKDTVELKVNIAGGKAPYTLILKEDGDEIQRMEVSKAGKQKLSYKPTEFGEYTLKVVVKDSNDNKEAAEAKIKVAVDETESASEWEESVKDVELTGDWRKDLIAIAKSQLGYKESERNYVIKEDGKVQGYTRYGAWYGNPYEEWCAMFVSFCLNYADIKAAAFPREAECIRWMNTLIELDAFVVNTDESDYTPSRGDIIFFNVDDAERNPSHVGIVERVSLKKGKVYTIEGNSAKQVRRREYDLTDSHIAGYGSIEALMERAEVLEQFQNELPTIPEEGIIGTTNTTDVNMREYAGTDYPVVLTIEAADTEVTVFAVEEVNDEVWYEVECGDTVGYIRSDFLEVEIPEVVETEVETEVAEEIESATEVVETEVVEEKYTEAVVQNNVVLNTYEPEVTYRKVPNRPVVEEALAVYSEEEGASMQPVVLPIAGKLILTADFDYTAEYQWQAYDNATGQWANIVGDNDTSCTLTYAKIENILGDSYAQVRCRITEGENVFVSDVAMVYVDENVTYTVVEEVSELEEEMVAPADEVQQTFSLRKNVDIGVETIADDETTQTENKDKYFVVINYLFEDNQIVTEPYTAELAAGSNFVARIMHPEIVGYQPYVNDYESLYIDLNINNIQGNQTFNVVYKPTNVSYTVIHYQQNLINDKYTEIERETLIGLTNDLVGEVANQYSGFYALLYVKPIIAADSSTVVEIYYDRNYYLMNFDLDGGYGVEPIYAKYGANIEVSTPIKAGYSFNGWKLRDKDGNLSAKIDIPTMMPSENQTYVAQWTPEQTAKVTVVFWGENANDEEYSYIKSAALYVEPNSEYTYSGDNTRFIICGHIAHAHEEECEKTLECKVSEHEHSGECCKRSTTHVHSTACFDNVGTRNTDTADAYGAPSNPTDGTVYKRRGGWGSSYDPIIYINGTWYRYNGNVNSGTTEVQPNSSCPGVHTHGDGKCECSQTEHTHVDKCYTYECGLEVHSHSNSCYQNGAGMDSKLWKYMRSDSVTVNADGSTVVNVYYDRIEYTLKFNVSSSTVRTITGKWGMDIRNYFPIVNENNGTIYSKYWWDVPNNATTLDPDNYIASLDVMPPENLTFTRSNEYNAATIYYYVETVDGIVDATTINSPYSDGLQFTLFKKVETGQISNLTYEEDFHPIVGFSRYKSNPSFGNNTSVTMKTNNYMYYTRNTYGIEFYNPTELIKTESLVKYQSNLGKYDWTPGADMAPKKYEPGSVTFAGWYLNPECSGEPYDLSEHTMPAGTNAGDISLSLYAKWVPVTHTVKFYLDKDAYNEGITLASHPEITVNHGAKVQTAVAVPTNGDYKFVAWFYEENGVEKAFDFVNMPINKDMKVYAKWSSDVLKEYTVYYMVKGTETEIADPTIGSAPAGTSKTFDAKGGEELEDGYKEGYFPLVKSHTIKLDIEDESQNTFIFWYVQKDAVPYTVKYLNKATGEPVAIEKTVADNRKAVVTETFVTVTGMMPDAYQKRLVVDGTEGAVNEIIFYYTEDITHAYYKITHYTQNTDGNNWTEYASSEIVGDIGTTYTADPLTIYGFTYQYIEDLTIQEGELTAEGLELKLYYVRNVYPYEVRYLKQGTSVQLEKSKTGNGMYGQIISENAINISNYTVVGSTAQTLNIKIEESPTEAKVNIITFYYKEKEATINYVVVGPEGSGRVTLANEKLKVLTGPVQGSSAVPNEPTYKFVGWYLDDACTQPVDNSWVVDNKITPQKQDTDKNTDTAAIYESATYYAKFDYNLTSLVITKEGLKVGDTAIFTVSGEGKTWTVSITGTSQNPKPSVKLSNLTVGQTYTVTESTNWSWRYTVDDSSQSIVLDPDPDNSGVNTISFVNTPKDGQWLDDEDCTATNVFNKTN